MLVIASPASAEIGTDRPRPGGPSGRTTCLSCARSKPLLVLDQFGFDPFPVDGKRNENDFSVDSSDAGASECDVMDVQFDNRT